MSVPRTANRTIAAGAVLVAGLVVIAALVIQATLYSAWPAFLPAALLALLLLATRSLRRPAEVLAIYLVLIVNLDFFKIAGSTITADVILSALVTWVLLVRMLLARQPLVRGPVSRLYAIFLAATLVSVALSVAPLESFKRWGRDFEYLVLFAFLISGPMTERERRNLTGAIILSALVPCFVGLLSLVVDMSGVLRLHYLDPQLTHLRVAAHLSHPVTLSLFLLVTATVTLAHLLSNRRFPRFWLTVVLALQVLVIVLTFARTGWIGFLFAVLTLFWLRGERWLLWVVTPLMVIGLLLVVPSLQQRMESALVVNRENSLLWRLGLWAHALTLFPQRPIFGSGPGTFIEYVAYSEGFASHQTWLGLLIETGVAGLLAFVALIVTLTRALWRRRRALAQRVDPLVDAAIASLVGLLVASLTAGAFGLPAVMIYFWALVALALQPVAAASADA
jgi:putative inorganic carbon (hco3(-)) transporter